MVHGTSIVISHYYVRSSVRYSGIVRCIRTCTYHVVDIDGQINYTAAADRTDTVRLFACAFRTETAVLWTFYSTGTRKGDSVNNIETSESVSKNILASLK